MTLRANHLTVLRVILLPLPYFLIYQGTYGRVAALLIFTALGITDYLDGFLARRQGTTRLGKLLDPIADKIFLVVIMVCLVDLEILPYWLVIPIFMRESLVAEIRRAGITLEVTELAKIKTTIQMAASGLIFLLDTFHSKVVLVAFLSGAILATLFLAVALFIRDGTISSRMKWALGLLGLALFFAVLLPEKAIFLSYGVFIVIITLVSGGQYILKGIPEIISKGPSQCVRALITTIFPIFPLVAMGDLDHQDIWAVLVVLSLEYATQGLDAMERGDTGIDLSRIKAYVLLPVLSLLLIWPGIDTHMAFKTGAFLYATYLLGDFILNKKVVFDNY